MASIKKKSSGGGGANWMDTYGDMVTLLLCFFVLLYSMSTIDQTKWMLVVQSFNRNAIVNPNDAPPGPVGSETDNSGGDGMPTTTEVEQALDELFEFLQSYAASQDAGTVSVSQGDGYIFISFDDTVFFAGDSFDLRADGRAILDDIIPALTKCGPYIDELEVLGHTAQASPSSPNPIPGDRRLASNRATEVVIYLQQRIDASQLEPGRLVAKGFGQWRPVSDNDVEENRAKNRRVELVVTGRNLDELDDNFQKYFSMYNEAAENVPEYTTDD